ncbi:MAG: tRNA (adenosine(37)-N6)-dimethylallyltransferase MiaA [Ignavibacteriae bacterium]|nr:MAG: tRNA (adenosine(37)-N6)-dimethylallyltransferase MiaA [Ignavibacteriota bacterium]
MKAKVLAIVGPTASGKTEIAFQVAKLVKNHFNKTPEIISADSRQIYKKIQIAAAHPPEEYLKNIKHHFINEYELTDEFNAGEFGEKAGVLIKDILDKGSIPVIAGGSGLYLRSLIYGLFDFEEEFGEEEYEEKKDVIRNKLNERLEAEGSEALYNELLKVDSITAGKFDATKSRRIIRALEVFYLTGTPISQWHENKVDVGFETIQYGINWERPVLYNRINKRVDNMLNEGLLEEIDNLKKEGYHYKHNNSLNTVGVKEAFDYLDGKIEREEMIELIKRNTRRYAKRQMTWFRKDKNIKWIDVNDEVDFKEIAEWIFIELYG